LSTPSLNICIVYDRIYPTSIGGAERWYRLLAERLAAEGHRVTYLTARHWEGNATPGISGVRIVDCAGQSDIYDAQRRRIAPVLAFGLGVGRHLLRHGADYDVVHSSATLSWAAVICLALSRFRRFNLVLDWWEVWTLPYWRSYLGRWAGFAGWLLQWLVAIAPHQPLSHSALHARRLRRLRQRGDVPTLRGVIAQPTMAEAPIPAEPLVLYVGRHIAEKQIPAIVPALAAARQRLPRLRATLFGTGPDADKVRHAVQVAGLQSVVDLPGFVSEATLQTTLQRALCLILLSRREGYGLVVAEAAAYGVPSIVLRHADSAALELIVDDVNGVACESIAPETVASAILRVHDAGYAMRQRTLAWSCKHARELSIESSLPHLLALYRGEIAAGETVR
jgi:glycosyltransferase involved in cell wall biosynthesis